MFGPIPRRMPFLGAETAFPCVGGRQVGIFPVLGPGRPKQARFLADEIPGDIWAAFYRPWGRQLGDRASENRLAVTRTITGGFFVETVPKRYMFGTGAPRKRLDLV
jgi:hypothetical protein